VKAVKRARLKRFEFLVSEATVASPQFARVLSRVDHLNGYWERVFGGIGSSTFHGARVTTPSRR
jgi:hypothetical protein